MINENTTAKDAIATILQYGKSIKFEFKTGSIIDLIIAVCQKYDLDEDYSIETGIIFGRIYRHNGEWKFAAVGDGYVGGLRTICDRYGI